jgi:UDP-N-acetyl-D-mannosaminuronate dehydrogenase
MPAVVVERVARALNTQGKSIPGSRILLLGVSYKKDVGDVRESPALKVIDHLHHEGARVAYHDPYVPVCVNGIGPMASVGLDEQTITGADCIVILTDHSDLPYDRILHAGVPVVDTRNALRNTNGARVTRL